ncbi:hypothetical protein FRC11_000468, partial [Ceratobasidium sp. 423]
NEIKAEFEKHEEDKAEPRQSQHKSKPVKKYSAKTKEAESKPMKKKKAKKPKSKSKRAKAKAVGMTQTKPKPESDEKIAFKPMSKPNSPGKTSEDPMFKIIMEDPSQNLNFKVQDGALYLKQDGEKLLCIPDIMKLIRPLSGSKCKSGGKEW